jgi:GT2 family glycosyltransferase
MKIGIGIATRGRPAVLAETIAYLNLQRRAPDKIVVAYADEQDIQKCNEKFPGVLFAKAELGLTRQRNAILELAADLDILVFIDDDFLLDAEYLTITEQLFDDRQEVVVATGKVLADGINGAGLTFAEGNAVLNEQANRAPQSTTRSVFNAYGCNMCIRMKPVREHLLRFDEILPLYGWYEDVDFSRQLARFGSVVQMDDARGVHLGVKSGRTSGVKLGYSQIANPIYLMRKGTFPRSHMFYSITVRFAKNLVRSLAPEPYVDRRGRLRGNLLGLRDLLTKQLSPGRVISL